MSTEPSGWYINNIRLDADGRYQIQGLTSGDYYVRVNSYDDGYFDELYQDVTCVSSCDVKTGARVTVTQGHTVSAIDFVLKKSGSISGTVLGEDGVPVDGVVYAYDVNGNYVSYGRADQYGHYKVDGMSSDNYYLAIYSFDGRYISQLYQGLSCVPDCRVTSGTPVAVIQGQTTAGVDFSLKKAGAISGTVIGEDGGVVNGYVDAFDANGSYQGTSGIDAKGQYQIQGLATGNYHVRVSSYGSGYIGELYQGISCESGCDVASGTSVAVTQGLATTGIDFSLKKSGSIGGTVTADDGGVVDGYVFVYDANGRDRGNGRIDGSGRYQVQGLPTGNYYVLAYSYSSGYVGELYHGVSCGSGCNVTTGTPVAVTLGQATSGIDFLLKKTQVATGSGSIRGSVTGENGGVVSGFVEVKAYDANGGYRGWSYVGADGQYRIQNLPVGNYYLKVSRYGGEYIDELYNGVSCDSWCAVTTGTPVSVTQGEISSGIDFVLKKKGSISGTVTGKDGGVVNGVVEVRSLNQNYYHNFTNINANGDYQITGLLPGSYSVSVRSNDGRYLDEDYVTVSGNVVTVEQGNDTSGINFSLQPIGSLAGRVKTQNGVALGDATVAVFDSSGVFVRSTSTDMFGKYSMPQLALGDYYLVIQKPGYVPVIYDGVIANSICSKQVGQAPCNLTTGKTFAISLRGMKRAIHVTLALAVDNDRDSLDDYLEPFYGLDSTNHDDVNADWDHDGIANLQEILQGTDPNKDSTAPVLPQLPEIKVAAFAPLTPMMLEAVVAHDLVDGDIVANADKNSPFTVGEHLLTWTATDKAGNSSSVIQKITVLPVVNIGLDQSVYEGALVTVKASLSTEPSAYPVEVPFTIAGTASNPDDHNAVSGVLIFMSGTEAAMSFNVVNDGVGGEADETVVITLGDTAGTSQYLLGDRKQQIITVTESNLVPKVKLRAQQGDLFTRTAVQGSGRITVTAAVHDENRSDSHGFDWSGSDNRLIDQDGNPANGEFVFDPAIVMPGLYNLHLRVTDQSGASTSTNLLLNVVANAPSLSESQDGDSDGLTDAQEGYGDADNDGVPDYLDAIASSFKLQGKSGEHNSYQLQTSPGLQLMLGNAAQSSGNSIAAVSEDEVMNYGGNGIAVAGDESYHYPLGLYDFVVTGLPNGITSVQVVLPQTAVIPAGAVYRKYIGGGWQEFVVNGANSIASAPGLAGYCPPPGDTAYVAGLHEGDYCIQLTLEDGGPNDADGEINGSVKDPGGLAVVDSASKKEKPALASGGGGTLGLELVLLLLLLCYGYYIRRAGLIHIRR